VEYLRNASNDPRIHKAVDTLCELYDEIISQDMKNEIQSLRRRLSSYEEIILTEVNNWGANELLQWSAKWGYTESLCNLAILFRIFFNNVYQRCYL